MKCFKLHTTQTGLTLIEIMIAMLLGLFLIGGVIQLFIGSKQNYRVQENISRVQENGRFALYFLNKDIRMAGFWGCVKNNNNVITNHLDPAGKNYDANIHQFDQPVTGTNGTTDSITIRGAMDSGIRVTPPYMNTNSAAVHVEAGNGLSQSDIILITDCRQADIFQLTNANPDTSGSVIHNTGSATNPGNASKDLSKTYEDDARIYSLQTITYSIQT